REENPTALIVIWSGGGTEYARAVADELLPGIKVETFTKSTLMFPLVRAQDIVVDDMDIKVPAKVLRPDDPEITGSVAQSEEAAASNPAQ
ncbi:hypothetical protein LCGC14_2651360, partial [marine sediment metagenome]